VLSAGVLSAGALSGPITMRSPTATRQKKGTENAQVECTRGPVDANLSDGREQLRALWR
jgi:hypothetical protein